MSAMDELRRLLDECGVEHYDYIAEVWWGGESSGGGGAKYTAYEQTDGLICVEIADLTPEQAIAATLGRDNAERYVGLRQGKYWERTENSDYYCGGCGWKVTDHDSYCPECGGALHKAALDSSNCTNSERTCGEWRNVHSYYAPTVEDVLLDMHRRLSDVSELYDVDSDELEAEYTRIIEECASKLQLAGDAE